MSSDWSLFAKGHLIDLRFTFDIPHTCTYLVTLLSRKRSDVRWD